MVDLEFYTNILIAFFSFSTDSVSGDSKCSCFFGEIHKTDTWLNFARGEKFFCSPVAVYVLSGFYY